MLGSTSMANDILFFLNSLAVYGLTTIIGWILKNFHHRMKNWQILIVQYNFVSLPALKYFNIFLQMILNIYITVWSYTDALIEEHLSCQKANWFLSSLKEKIFKVTAWLSKYLIKDYISKVIGKMKNFFFAVHSKIDYRVCTQNVRRLMKGALFFVHSNLK